eukprot:GHVU01146549.1.p1 GENE.GHVU01146549.1~~GHVU01146549.1.p1  ORF type:complete len:136 (+),score=6.99 GHVU01146549.1:138-545(+)
MSLVATESQSLLMCGHAQSPDWLPDSVMVMTRVSDGRACMHGYPQSTVTHTRVSSQLQQSSCLCYYRPAANNVKRLPTHCARTGEYGPRTQPAHFSVDNYVRMCAPHLPLAIMCACSALLQAVPLTSEHPRPSAN